MYILAPPNERTFTDVMSRERAKSPLSNTRSRIVVVVFIVGTCESEKNHAERKLELGRVADWRWVQNAFEPHLENSVVVTTAVAKLAKLCESGFATVERKMFFASCLFQFTLLQACAEENYYSSTRTA